MIEPVNGTNTQKKRSEYDPIWKRIYVERVWRLALFVFMIIYVVGGISIYLDSHNATNVVFFFIITCGYIFGIVNYFFIERYWRRIGQRRAQALQVVKREELPESRQLKADEHVLPLPTTLRLHWGRAYVLGVRIVSVLMLVLAAAGGVALLLDPGMKNAVAIPLLILAVFAVMIGFGLILGSFLAWRYQGQSIEITDEGIRTRYMRQERFIRWDEARLFASYGAQGINKNLLVETYELSNEETVVRWSQQSPAFSMLSVQSDAGLKDDWNWLVGQVNTMVHAQTELPLTDLGDNSQIPQWLAQRWTGQGRAGSVHVQANRLQNTNAQENSAEQVTANNEPERAVSAIGQNDPMQKRVNNRQIFQAIMIFGIFGLVLLVVGIVGIFASNDVWLNSFSQFFIVAGAFFLICTLFIGIGLRAVARYWYRVQQARQEALRQPREFLAATQPEVSSERPASVQMWTKHIVNLLITLGLGLVFYTLFIYPFVHVSNIGLRLLVSAGIALVMALFAAILGISLSKRTRRLRVTIVNDGIGTRFGGVDSMMRWQDAALFATYYGTNLWGGVNKKVRIYELASGQTVVRWQGMARIRYMDTQPKMDQQQFERWQEQLKGYIVEKTGLPLIELEVGKAAPGIPNRR